VIGNSDRALTLRFIPIRVLLLRGDQQVEVGDGRLVRLHSAGIADDG
jgi:hypothetical protein